MKLTRRNFIKLGATTAAVFAARESLQGEAFALGRRLKSDEGGKKREVIATTCWQCVARDPILCYVEDGRLVKIEGNPESIRNRGKICAKGQAGINQLYDPDRILYPMKRMGKRGEGEWKRISWDDALDLLVNGGEIAGRNVNGLKALLDKGHPERFMFHYGRMKGSESKIIKNNFCAAFGTSTFGNHTSICSSAKYTGQELTWGKGGEMYDVENTNMILNMGLDFFSGYGMHVQLASRAINAMTERGVKLYTFDVRLSPTAAKSTEWIPIKPGTDLAVLLAMSHVVMNEGLYDKDFIENWTNVTVDQLKKHLQPYTPEWAEVISGVSASKIRSIAIEYGNAKPGTCMSYKSPNAHYNGVESSRAMRMLDALCGYINIKGGTCRKIAPKWRYPKVKGKTKKLGILDGLEGDAALPNHHVSHRVFRTIKDGSKGRPEVYMIYCHNPVYANGDVQDNIDIMKDENLIPFIVNVNPFYDESASLSDLILPDVTFLERWSWVDVASYENIPEFGLSQPVVKTLGEARQLQDVVIELAQRLGLKLGFDSTEDFIRKSCQMTGVDFEYLKKHGVWHDSNAKVKYKAYATEVKPEKYTAEGVLFDDKTGVYWNWKKSKAKSREEAIKKGYTWTKNAYKGYVGQKVGDGVYVGFKPVKINKSGKYELYSEILKEKGFSPMPSWMPIPVHEKMSKDELILTSYKVNVQIHSRSANCKWLTEIYHDNPAWINPETAVKRGIHDGDKIKVKSIIGEIITKARLTEGIHPGVIAISHHLGHWEYGRYASGKKSPMASNNDSGQKYIWWKDHGVHPNWIIPNAPDPIAGSWCSNDTVVTVTKA